MWYIRHVNFPSHDLLFNLVVQLQSSMMRLQQDVPLKHSDFLNLKIKVMAEQKGIIPLRGTIGNITFYKSKD